MNTEKNLNLNLTEIFQDQYIIPLYQRNFAWRKDEIEQLLQDIYESFRKNPSGNYYIGSLVTLKRRDGVYEVIDGQQRLTVLSLITKMLGITNNACLTYESRPEVEMFFKHLYKLSGNYAEELKSLDHPQIFHLKEAVGLLDDIKDKDEKSIIGSGEDFNRFISTHVILVRVEIPEDTDVASYFEIMNNRGVQLQKHEIIKARMLSKIESSRDRLEFAEIWDACSQMNIPVQKLFDKNKRELYFGKGYDGFVSDTIFKNELYESQEKSEPWNIERILHEDNKHYSRPNAANDDEDEDDNDDYNSIIDFPNFLMHIFRLFYNKIYKEDGDIPLNEKYLIEVYDDIESGINSETFVKQLFHCRTVFDNYLPKTIPSSNEEDSRRWCLRKPHRYIQTKKDTWKLTDTFGKDEDGVKKSEKQTRIIHALSMLQVTYRTRIYKEWLQELLAWLTSNSNITYSAYIGKIDEVILQNYDKDFISDKRLKMHIDTDGKIMRENTYSEGTQSKHFLFNFIDYLYWVESHNITKHGINHSCKDFDFKYWNSVEHHFAQNKARQVDDSDRYIDNLGNLCLVSRSANSSLSDRDVKEKVKMNENKNLGAKRQIMYEMTKNNNYNWEEPQMIEHYNELVDLLSKRKEILADK